MTGGEEAKDESGGAGRCGGWRVPAKQTRQKQHLNKNIGVKTEMARRTA